MTWGRRHCSRKREKSVCMETLGNETEWGERRLFDAYGVGRDVGEGRRERAS